MLRSWYVSYQTTPLRPCQIIRFRWWWTPTVGYFELEVSDSSWHLVGHRDPIGWVMRLCSQLIWSFWLASRAYFETRGVPFSHFHWIESCGSMLHWDIFPLHHFLAVLAFRATIHARSQHSKSPLFSLAFRATMSSQSRRSESSFSALHS